LKISVLIWQPNPVNSVTFTEETLSKTKCNKFEITDVYKSIDWFRIFKLLINITLNIIKVLQLDDEYNWGLGLLDKTQRKSINQIIMKNSWQEI